ncbi:MAG: spondin domain-containing protein [Pseudomonadales bacterium]|nr:spondin domain-containing protein [Pseudomonadales bacterium]
MKRITSIAAAALLTTASAVNADSYDTDAHYSVSITNITKGMTFTPFISASHNKKASFFTLGETASDEINHLAEGGNITPLQAQLNASMNVMPPAAVKGY